MIATSRSSAPSSRAMPTMPEAPPAIIPSAAVGGSASVVRVRMRPQARLSTSVAALTTSDRQPGGCDRVERRRLDVGAEHDAGDGLRGGGDRRRHAARARRVPDAVFTAAQAVTGVVLGAYLQSSSLAALGEPWLPVALVSAARSCSAWPPGLLLARDTPVDPPTAALGHGGRRRVGHRRHGSRLGADDRLVAFMQYLRVLVVVLLTPLRVAVLFPATAGGAAHAAPTRCSAPRGLADRARARRRRRRAAGRAPARARRVAAGPDDRSPASSRSPVPGGTSRCRALLREAAFSLIGLQVGLRFTMATVRLVGPPDRPGAAALVGPAGGLLRARGRARRDHAGLRCCDAYLATTPGGLYAVLAVAFGADANTTFIVAVQGLRLLVMVLLAPAAVRLLVGRPAKAAA